jgi:broad specificity phosphatase PhoE
VASDEPKASETLAGASNGAAIAIDPDFGEVRRPPDWTDAHRALAAAYVGGATHAGWEPHDAVVRRFDAAVRRHQAAAAADRHLLVIGTHGMAMTLWLASRVQLDRDPVAFWAGLEFPDVVVVESGRALTRRG